MVATAGLSLRNRVARLLPVALMLMAARTAAAVVTVEDCIRQALDHAPTVRAAGFDSAAAAARLRAAGAAYAPQLSAHAEYGRAYGFDEAVTNGGSTAAVVTLEGTLLDGGVRAAQLAAARSRIQSTAAIERQRRADVAQAVATAYFTALEGRREVEIERDNASMLRDAVAALQRQTALGLAPRNDVLRAQLAAKVADAELRAASAQQEASLRDLQTLVGSEITARSLADTGDLPELSEVGAESIDASPLLADVRAATEAAEHDAEAVRSEWYPQLTLSASGGALGVKPGTTFRKDGGGQFLVGVTVPLFDGGTRSARVAAAAAAAASAAATAQQTRQVVTTALARAKIEAARARADAIAYRQTVEQASENLSLMRARYSGGGDVRLLEVLDALTQFVQARLNLARAELAFHLALSTRRQLLGDPGI